MKRIARFLPPPEPLRTLTAVNLANSVGDGAFAAVSIVYLVSVVGLQPTSVTAGLAAAAGLALAAGIPAGMLADRVGPTRVLPWLYLAEAVSVALYPLITTWAVFMLLASVGTVASRATAGVRNGLIARVIAPTERVHARAYLRSVTSAGAAVGAALAGLTLLHPSREGMTAVFLLDAVTFALALYLVHRLPRGPNLPRPQQLLTRLVTNRPFLIASLGQAALSLHTTVLTVALPLWIVTRTQAPTWLVSVIISGSTILAVVLQVPASRYVKSARSVTTATWVAGVLIAVACLVIAPTGGLTSTAASVVLLVGCGIRLVGDLLQAVSGWSMSFAAPPLGGESTYQATYSPGYTLAAAAGPLLSGWIVTRPGGIGWLWAAASFLIVGIIAATAGRTVMNGPPSR